MKTRPAKVPNVSLETASQFVAASGFVIDEVSDTRLTGHVELGEDHFTGWGVVHGGLYTTIVESAGSVAASHAVSERNQFSVGVHNATDFLRPSTGGRATVTAKALQQVKSGRRVAFAEGEVLDAQGKIVATASRVDLTPSQSLSLQSAA